MRDVGNVFATTFRKAFGKTLPKAFFRNGYGDKYILMYAVF